MTDKLLDEITRNAINPAFALLPLKMSNPVAVMLLLAIGLQESGLTARCQIAQGGGRGPARGLWQFERAGGVLGVLQHPKTKFHAQSVCKARGVAADSRTVWEALEHDDVLASAFARLLMYSDPLVLPDQKSVEAGWRLYALRTWRPGRPHPERWDGNHKRARLFVFGVTP